MGCWAFGTNFGAGNGKLNSSVFKSSNTRRGVLKFRINQCIVYISGTLNFQEMKEFIMMILKVCNLLFILLQKYARSDWLLSQDFLVITAH